MKRSCGVRSVVKEQLMRGGESGPLTSPMQVLWFIVLWGKVQGEKNLKRHSKLKYK